MCDGAPDCSDGYDEDMRLCTAGKQRFDILSERNGAFICVMPRAVLVLFFLHEYDINAL